MSHLTPNEAREHIVQTAVIEKWEPDEVSDALDDVDNGLDLSLSSDITSSSMAYGIVVGENEEADKKIAGFPEFGDVVVWGRLQGYDCSSFGRLSCGTGTLTHYPVRSRDGSREIIIKRGEKLVILDWQEVIGIRWTFKELRELEEKV